MWIDVVRLLATCTAWVLQTTLKWKRYAASSCHHSGAHIRWSMYQTYYQHTNISRFSSVYFYHNVTAVCNWNLSTWHDMSTAKLWENICWQCGPFPSCCVWMLGLVDLHQKLLVLYYRVINLKNAWVWRVVSNDVNTASGSKAKIFKAMATNFRKRQHLLLKQSTALHYGNADTMINVNHCILKKV